MRLGPAMFCILLAVSIGYALRVVLENHGVVEAPVAVRAKVEPEKQEVAKPEKKPEVKPEPPRCPIMISAINDAYLQNPLYGHKRYVGDTYDLTMCGCTLVRSDNTPTTCQVQFHICRIAGGDRPCKCTIQFDREATEILMSLKTFPTTITGTGVLSSFEPSVLDECEAKAHFYCGRIIYAEGQEQK